MLHSFSTASSRDVPSSTHGLSRRATASTGMDTLGFHFEERARVLNHREKDNSVTGIYSRKDQMGQKRRALDAWGKYLRAIVEGRKPPADVFDIKTGRKSA